MPYLQHVSNPAETVPMGQTWIDVDSWVALVIAVGKPLEDSVDLLRLFWQLNLHKQLSDSHINWISKEGKFPHVTPENRKHKWVIGLG